MTIIQGVREACSKSLSRQYRQMVGVNVFSVEYLKALREFCDKNDILMVVDDVQVGCARTGTFFSFERAGNQA